MDKEEINEILLNTAPRNILDSFISEHLGKQLLTRKKFIEGSGIIEIGSASTNVIPYIFQTNIPFYIGVDPFYEPETRDAINKFLKNNTQYEGRLNSFQEDALTFLIKQESESANIISSGVLDSMVIGYYCFFRYRGAIIKKYQEELASEIYRVTPRGGLSYHHGIDEEWTTNLLKTGFKKEDSIDSFLKL